MLCNQAAYADFSCKFDSDQMTCLPSNPVSEDLSDRVKRSRILFENKLCVVNEVSLSGDTEWNPTPYEIHIYVRYECKKSKNGSDQSTATAERQMTTARYQFSCALRQYKFFASGFDILENGTRSHWDSQGTSREIPWQPLVIGTNDSRLAPLFRTWCE
jgi:hypothetical protein